LLVDNALGYKQATPEAQKMCERKFEKKKHVKINLQSESQPRGGEKIVEA
jgi:hypothetical protein